MFKGLIHGFAHAQVLLTRKPTGRWYGWLLGGDANFPFVTVDAICNMQ